MSDRWTARELDNIRETARRKAGEFEQWQNDGSPLRNTTATNANPATPSTEQPTETEPTPMPTTPTESDTRIASVHSSAMRAVGAFKNGEARAMRRQA